MERPISSNALAQVQAAVFNGEKIAAIKIYREDTGASLKDAKDAVEKLEAEWRAASPEKLKTPARTTRGCGTCLALLAVFGLLGVILFLFVLRKGSVAP
jgi:hypothetical protein